MEEMLWFNQSSDVDKIPGLIYFASDRGGTPWAFDTKSTKVVELYVDTIHDTDVEVIADTFEKFIEYVYNIDDSGWI